MSGAEMRRGEEKYVRHDSPLPSGRRETLYREDGEDPDYQETRSPLEKDEAVEAFVRSFTEPLSE
ncbi:MAG: hypothetical protein ABEI58_04485 [Candidatus Nanohaloarchaea archaeon]